VLKIDIRQEEKTIRQNTFCVGGELGKIENAAVKQSICPVKFLTGAT